MKRVRRFSIILFLLVFAFPVFAQEGAPAVAENEIGDPAWGFKFEKPEGWVHQQTENGAVLGHNSIPGMIIVFIHMAGDMEQMKQEMAMGVEEIGSHLVPTYLLVGADGKLKEMLVGFQDEERVVAALESVESRRS